MWRMHVLATLAFFWNFLYNTDISEDVMATTFTADELYRLNGQEVTGIVRSLKEQVDSLSAQPWKTHWADTHCRPGLFWLPFRKNWMSSTDSFLSMMKKLFPIRKLRNRKLKRSYSYKRKKGKISAKKTWATSRKSLLTIRYLKKNLMHSLAKGTCVP